MSGWLLNLIIGSLPSSLWLILTGIGIAGYFGANVLGYFPPLRLYSKFIRPVALLITAGSIFMYGGSAISDYYKALIAELEQKVKIAEEKSATVNTVIEERIKYQTRIIKDKQVEYRDRIIEIAPGIDAQCRITPETTDIHNRAATNPLKDFNEQHNRAAKPEGKQ